MVIYEMRSGKGSRVIVSELITGSDSVHREYRDQEGVEVGVIISGIARERDAAEELRVLATRRRRNPCSSLMSYYVFQHFK